MNLEIERAMREVLEAWETPDSPEAMVGAMYQLRRIYENETRRQTPQRRKKTPRNTPPSHHSEAGTAGRSDAAGHMQAGR